MAEIIEEFFTGYCRNFDMTQTVICEFEQLPDGLHLLDSSCEYGDCKFSKDCTLMKQALDKENACTAAHPYAERFCVIGTLQSNFLLHRKQPGDLPPAVLLS